LVADVYLYTQWLGSALNPLLFVIMEGLGYDKWRMSEANAEGFKMAM